MAEQDTKHYSVRFYFNGGLVAEYVVEGTSLDSVNTEISQMYLAGKEDALQNGIISTSKANGYDVVENASIDPKLDTIVWHMAQ
ncbi:hypothetical protein [Lactobacillus selangorensis]|nr:hypothetical protein [Lactobacillus selangorensis]